MNNDIKLSILEVAIKNQILLSKYLDAGIIKAAYELKEIDNELYSFFITKNDNQVSTRSYIWRTQGDEKVRPSHKSNNGKIFSYDNPPPTGNPGDEYGCRCWAEPYTGEIYDPPLEDVYPELLLLPLLRAGRGALALAGKLLTSQGRIPKKPVLHNMAVYDLHKGQYHKKMLSWL